MPDSLSFADLSDQLRAGSDDAAARAFEIYAHRLIDVARNRLEARLRDKAQPDDLMHSVLRSLIRRVKPGVSERSEWNSLWNIPVMLTLQKCGRRLQVSAPGEGCPAKTALHPAGLPAASATDDAAVLQTLATGSLDEEAAQLVQILEEVQRGFDGEDRKIVVLCLQDLRPPEVSAELGITQRHVYRVLDRVRARLQRLRDT